MNTLIRKEVRLLLPAWLAAMGLCLLPFLIAALNSFDPAQTHVHFALYTIPIACAILGLASFGREFSGGAFSLLLSQPRPRHEFWNAKLTVLGVAVLTVLMAIMLTTFPFLPSREAAYLFWLWALAALVATTGALWMTLLLRQLIAAFWLSLLAPLAVTLLISATPDEVLRKWFLISTLLAYSLAGYLFGRKLFLTAQDVAWTGGTLTLPTPRRWLRRDTSPQLRKSRPLVALFRKEFQSHQISVVLAVLLFAANVGVMLIQKFATVSEKSVLNILFEGFFLLWFVMPLMIGCTAVAEERRLGTLETQLSLPISRIRQFLVKVASVIVFAVLLGAIPIWLSHFVALRFGLKEHGQLSSPDAKYIVAAASIIISLIALYASTLCRQFMQALAATIGCFAGLILMGNLLLRPPTVSGYELWQGPIGTLAAGVVALVFAFGLMSWRGRWRLALMALSLVSLGVLAIVCELLLRGQSLILVFFYKVGWLSALAGCSLIAGPILLLLVLAFRNFRHVQSSNGLWLKNILAWVAVFFLTILVGTAAYNRVWELAMRFEPPAGLARVNGNVRPMIAKYFRSGWLLALLPDGRLWAMREYETQPYSGDWTGNEPGWSVTKIHNPRADFVGSNWVCMALSQFDGAGVQSDGSLWRVSWWETDSGSSESVPAGAGNWYRKGQKLRQTPITLTRLGADSDWVMTAAGNAHFLALKRDGTLWGWGDNSSEQLGNGLPKVVGSPVQLGADTDWEFIATFSSGSIAVKRDHTVWKWGQAYPITSRGIRKGYIGGQPQKIVTLPAKAERILSTHYSDVFMCEDGTGWGLGQLSEDYLGSGNQFIMITELQKLWEGGKWVVPDSEYPHHIMAIRNDGSLWKQGEINRQSNVPNSLSRIKQLGERHDWIAVRCYYETTYALARDGTLCRFGDENYGGPELTRPTRRVTWSVNVLDSVK